MLDGSKYQSYMIPIFRRSSAVEQLTVNQLVVGSIPTAGAKNHCRCLILLKTSVWDLANRPKAHTEIGCHFNSNFER